MDFSSSVSKFEKEAEKRKKQAKEKQRLEAAAKRRQAQLDKEREALARRRKEDEEAAREEDERKQREETRITGGVLHMKELHVVFLEGEDDKVILPQSSLEELMGQNAFDHGPMCFRLWTSEPGDSSSRITHCGVREFTAEEGTVQIPKKVLDSLGLSEIVRKAQLSTIRQEKEESSTTPVDSTKPTSEKPDVKVTLKFVLMSKVNNVRIQPCHNLFSHVGPVKLVLEENLKYHSTLTVGDVLTVYYRGSEHILVVRDISLDSDEEVMDVEDEEGQEKHNTGGHGSSSPPLRGGTLINTDVVVDIDISEEFEKKIKSEESTPGLMSGGESLKSASAGKRLGSTTNTIAGAHLDAVNQSFPSLLPPVVQSGFNSRDISIDDEPEAGATNVITCKIKTPQGKTFTRRFEKAKPLRQLFAFVYSMLQTHQLPSPREKEIMQLSTRQPVRRFSEAESVNGADTFLTAGFESNSEIFFVAFV